MVIMFDERDIVDINIAQNFLYRILPHLRSLNLKGFAILYVIS